MTLTPYTIPAAFVGVLFVGILVILLASLRPANGAPEHPFAQAPRYLHAMSRVAECQSAGGVPRSEIQDGLLLYRGCDFPATPCSELYELLRRAK